MNFATIIRRNLRQRIARNVAMVFSVALVAALTTAFVAGREFFRSSDKIGARPLIIVDPIYPYGATLHEADLPKIRALPNVAVVARSYIFDVRLPDGSYGAGAGNDEAYFNVFNSDGVWFRTDAEMVDRWRKDRMAFIVGETTAKIMGFEVGHQYVLTTNGGPLTVNCVGISRGGANKLNLIVHYEYANDALAKREGRITRFLVEASDLAHMDSTMVAIDALFKTSATPTMSIPAGDAIQAVTSKDRSTLSLLGIVCLLIFFVTMFITLNTVLFLVRERRQVLASMRAIGFRSRHVFVLVAAEVMVLIMLGGVLGVGALLIVFHDGIPLGEGVLQVAIHPEAVVAGLAVTMVISIVASVIPSWLASRVDILNALRSA